ncbi:B12-binding domain-containing radical SAM protein [Lutispora thermophila]|uniref:B12 binding domain-containing protein n=1 Tax=Lutispora thermophila DSM 19022 TaxID=1122184 RepID=A0A1M6FWD6_9FIRM|nr:cobalamin-dependent protein [Lutispora thermophila]SHJ02045.1 B12 binding domain-containing protein [Lutispora thermophila DSM 19022]
MDIVLINPPNEENNNLGILPPLGLLYLVSALKSKKIDVEFLDLNINSCYERFNDILIKKEANIFGISCFTEQRNSTIGIVDKIKELIPESKIILGGVHVSFMATQILKNYKVDIIIDGEGEITICEVVKALKDNEDLNKVNGIVFKHCSNIIKTASRELISDLDSIPWPEWNVVDFDQYDFYKKYFNSFGIYPIEADEEIRGASIITSR